MEISIIKIIESTTVDGPGLRTSVYGAGCSHHCRGCHNPESWNIEFGEVMEVADVAHKVLETGENITFSGGDPFFQVDAYTELASIIKKNSNKNIWCYTGYRFEQLVNNEKFNKLLKLIDVLVDGKFVEEKKERDLLFRGSSNQRLIDVQKSLKTNEIIFYKSQFCILN